jgi:hypothetical protein
VWASGGGSGTTKASVNKVPQADDTMAPAAQDVTEKKVAATQLPRVTSLLNLVECVGQWKKAFEKNTAGRSMESGVKLAPTTKPVHALKSAGSAAPAVANAAVTLSQVSKHKAKDHSGGEGGDKQSNKRKHSG